MNILKCPPTAAFLSHPFLHLPLLTVDPFPLYFSTNFTPTPTLFPSLPCSFSLSNDV